MKRINQKTVNAALLLLILSLFALPGVGEAGQNNPEIQAPGTTLPDNPEASTTYLPIVRRGNQTPYLIGAEVNHAGAVLDLTNKAKAANIKWARKTGSIPWSKIEPVRTLQPTYNWSAVDENVMIGLANKGINYIAVVQWTPAWAQKYPGYSCGPVHQDYLDEFAQFLGEAVDRYSKPPYNVHYWEIGNEPDAPPIPDFVGQDSWFGCWGEPADDYYGGGYYATMLEKVYPVIKAADPSAKVILGGLLLDCDPTNPPTNPPKDCKPAHFLEGVLENNGKKDGANYFDILSFHGYPVYDGTMLKDENFPSWDKRGGVVLGKADFLREVMTKYKVNKPLYHSEGSLLCPPEHYPAYCSPPGQAFYEAQADYVVWLYVRDWANGMWATTWYEFEGPGWRYDSLLDGAGNPKPAYNALKFLTAELSEATYKGQIFDYPALRAYEFSTSGKKIWVIWSSDDQPHTIDLPPGTLKVLDKYGIQVYPTDNQIAVESPVYVEITP